MALIWLCNKSISRTFPLSDGSVEPMDVMELLATVTRRRVALGCWRRLRQWPCRSVRRRRKKWWGSCHCRPSVDNCTAKWGPMGIDSSMSSATWMASMPRVVALCVHNEGQQSGVGGQPSVSSQPAVAPQSSKGSVKITLWLFNSLCKQKTNSVTISSRNKRSWVCPFDAESGYDYWLEDGGVEINQQVRVQFHFGINDLVCCVFSNKRISLLLFTFWVLYLEDCWGQWTLIWLCDKSIKVTFPVSDRSVEDKYWVVT